MDDYKKYLADQILSEDKIVTYRILSRALKVHVNVAKQMLFDFHGWQNEKRPGAVHATYIIYGTKKASHTNGHAQHDEDVEMTSSPPEAASLAEEVPLVTLSVVAEEGLRDILSAYVNVSSIHVYSLGPHPVKDMQLLADVTKPILDIPSEDDAIDRPKTLAAVRNPYVRRRDRRGAAPRPGAPISKPAEEVSAPAKPAMAPKIKEELKAEKKPSSKESTPIPSGTKKPAPKRGASGGIMQSFAKAASKPKKATAPQPTTASAAEDSSLPALSDDGEDDSVAMPEPKEESETARKSRKERQEELKRMMEESSEEEEPEKEDTPMEEAEEEPPIAEPEKEAETEPAEVISSTGDGRRRGRRRVMKKKTVMDEQGYLVTVQEAGYESFSEDEPAPPPKKKMDPTSQPAKPKKAAPKGQGNIMSFFSKK